MINEIDARDSIHVLLEYLGEDSMREGLIDTPRRVIKSYDKLYGGYKQDPVKVLKPIFHVPYEEMVLLRKIPFYSTCEHHMLPFFGICSVGYIPSRGQDDGEYAVVGISKLARLVECFARRLQIQERLTNQIAETIDRVLTPAGVAVIMSAQHFCMTSRGVEKQGAEMITSNMRGVFLTKPEAREEFLQLCKIGG